MNGAKNTSVEFFRWGTAMGDNMFDLIVGSDIVYFSEACTPVAQSLRLLLKENGVGIIANDVMRYNNHEDAFERALIEEGLIVTERVVLQDERTEHKLLIIRK